MGDRITDHDVHQAILRLHSAVPKYGLTTEGISALVKIYRDALSYFDRETLEGSVRTMLHELDKFPTPAVWRAACREWLKRNRVQREWQPEQDALGRDIVCRVCRSVARPAALKTRMTPFSAPNTMTGQPMPETVRRMIAPCDPDKHRDGEAIVPKPENFLCWLD